MRRLDIEHVGRRVGAKVTVLVTTTGDYDLVDPERIALAALDAACAAAEADTRAQLDDLASDCREEEIARLVGR